MIRRRRTRIVATLGPASRSPEQVAALAKGGADVFRLNFSHGDRADHAAAFEAARAAEEAVGRPLAVMADLQGPKFRLGAFAKGGVSLSAGEAFRLDLDPAPGNCHRVSVPHPEIIAAMKPGMLVSLDDGKTRLRVGTVGQGWAETRIETGETLSDHKGISLPGAAIKVTAMTAKDRADLDFALRLGVDWIALSFVQRAEDMAGLRRLVAGRAGLLAKIEKPAALEELEAILDVSDAIMVARGDLGVELAPQEVPVAQKLIVRAARRRGTPVVIA
ncbi:MAG: pyruvate kinase, partial [Caulobacteraceae bacterium]